MSIKTVFLSSTARDLAKYRDAAYEAIEGLDGWHCVRMEDFGARDAMSDEFCRKKVAECDVFVGIVGHLYGSRPPGSEQSYTQREYEAAVTAKKPRLMFIAPDDFPLPARLIEPDEKQAKQRAFRDRVNAGRIRDTFTSPDDLARRVVQAIRNWEQEAVQRRPSTVIRRLPGQPALPGRPAQPVVAVDLSHQQDRWQPSYGSLRKMAEGLPNFFFQTIEPRQGLSRQSLQGCSALILALPCHCTLSEDEINDVRKWVWDDGGGLLLLGFYLADTHHGCKPNRLAREFGFEFAEDLIMPLRRSSDRDCRRQAFNAGGEDFWVSVELQDPETHQITEGVRRVAFLSSCSLTNISAKPELLVNSPPSAVMHPVGRKDANGWMRIIEAWIRDREASVPLLAAWRCSLGKVVAAGTWKLFLPAFTSENAPFDNARLFQNIMSWLAPSSESSVVETEIPGRPVAADVDEEQQHLRELIATKQHRLQVLELQAAKFGISTPPHITIEIEDLRQEIAKLETRLRS